MDAQLNCDIIIPVYNALEDLRQCLESVFENTSSDARIVIIDDKSHESGVEEYLRSLEAECRSNLIVKRNDENQGFVGTVNRGMRESTADVVLLNSDTIVTREWLEKLRACAYSDDSIASVTPLTNNGTICSIPNFCEDNNLPKGFTPQLMADLVEGISMKLHPSIPTGVGFCMYIKRKALQNVGFFDEETFGRGYGEENDWCCRASELGYAHVLDDATFVYHKGAMSFTQDKVKFIEKNLGLLIKKHPHYFEMIDSFIAENPLSSIHGNIKFHLNLFSPFIKIMVTVSSRNDFEKIPSFRNYPKTEVYACWLEDKSKIVLKKLSPQPEAEMRFPLNNSIGFPTSLHLEYRGLLEKIFNTFRINALLIGGLSNHSPEIINAAKNAGVSIYKTKTLEADGSSMGAKWFNAAIKKKWSEILSSVTEDLAQINRLEKAGAAPRLPLLLWSEIKAANGAGGVEPQAGYTEKQREAFNYLISLANRHRSSLAMAKMIYHLLSGENLKANKQRSRG